MTVFMTGNQPCLTVRKETFVTVQTRKCRLSLWHALLVFSVLQSLTVYGKNAEKGKNCTLASIPPRIAVYSNQRSYCGIT
jgi:hypothetical protein